MLGAVANVSGPRGAPVLSSYAAAIGLDCPVEVTCCHSAFQWSRAQITSYHLRLPYCQLCHWVQEWLLTAETAQCLAHPLSPCFLLCESTRATEVAGLS